MELIAFIVFIGVAVLNFKLAETRGRRGWLWAVLALATGLLSTVILLLLGDAIDEDEVF